MTLAACAVALVLLVDVSGSVSNEDYDLQKRGIIEAFKLEEISNIIEKSEGVAVSVVEWGMIATTSIDWHILRDKESINNFINKYSSEHRDLDIIYRMDTNITGALEYGVNKFKTSPCEPMQKIIDVSGDGPNGSHVPTRFIIEKAEELSITINGLPIISNAFPKLDEYYRENVTTMNGFVIPAEGFEDFGRAIRIKLIREIAEGIKNGKI